MLTKIDLLSESLKFSVTQTNNMPGLKNSCHTWFLGISGKFKDMFKTAMLFSTGIYLRLTGQFFYIAYMVLLNKYSRDSFGIKLFNVTNYQTTGEQTTKRWLNRNADNGHIWTGIFLLIVGGASLAKSLLIPMPAWLFSWQTFMIALGIFIGIRGNFHGAAWIILILIGGAFLINGFYPAIELRNRIWPLIIICLGALFIFRSGNRKRSQRREIRSGDTVLSAQDEDVADITTMFGSTQKTITSKQFASGDITCLFGSAELDLTHADINGPVLIDITAICGGVELIIPANWTIKSDVVSVFGSVRDKREQAVLSQDPEKTIILDGTALFGGIEINSFKK